MVRKGLVIRRQVLADCGDNVLIELEEALAFLPPVLVIRAECVEFRGLLCSSSPTSVQCLRQLPFEPAPVCMQQGSDPCGPHFCLGAQLNEGQLESVNFGCLSLNSCLVLKLHIFLELHLMCVGVFHVANFILQ